MRASQFTIINEDWSTYVSYTSIFQPQDKLTPAYYRTRQQGKSYEAGVKVDWFLVPLMPQSANSSHLSRIMWRIIPTPTCQRQVNL